MSLSSNLMRPILVGLVIPVFFSTVVISRVIAEELEFSIPGKVMVIVKRAKIMQGENELAPATVGEVLTVSQENGEWLGVPEKEGWILKKSVAPLGQAIEILTTRVNASKKATEYFHRGIAYLTLNQPEKALADFDVAIEKNPKYGTVYTSRGLAYQKLGKINEALANFTQALSLNDQDANAYYNRSVLYAEQNDFSKAMDDLNQSIAAYNKYAPAFNNRGILWSKQQEYNKAIADYTAAIQLNPQFAAAFANRGFAYKKLRKYESARNNYQNSIAIDDTAPQAHNDLAWLLATCPQKKFRDGAKAIKHATRACDAWKNKNIDGLDTLAAAYAELGKFSMAVTTIDKALKIAPAEEQAGLIKKRELYQSEKPFRDK